MLIPASVFSPVDLILASSMRKSWAGTVHRLTLTLKILGFFLHSGRSPGHPPHHLVTVTTKLWKVKNLLKGKDEIVCVNMGWWV